MEAAIARIAARQHGMVTRLQLLRLGLSAKAIDYRVKTGRLWLVHRGVYAVGRPPVTPQERAMAAVLACGPRAALSHGSGGALWELGLRWAEIMDVTAPAKRKRPGIRIHESLTLTPRDVTRQFGIPVTTPAQTLLDLAPLLDTPSLTRAVNEAQLRHKSTRRDLAELLERSPGRATKRLRPFVEETTGPTRSRFEDEFKRLTKRHGLPTPETNQIVAGYEVDALFRAQRLVVELDGEQHEFAFEEDRDRDAALLTAGFSTLRITWERFQRSQDREAERLHHVLDQRSTTAGPPA